MPEQSVLSPVVRPEAPGDAGAIRKVHEAAFGRPNEADLVEAIRRSPEFVPELSLVAEREGEIVGHAMLSLARIVGEPHAVEVLALAPVAVLPAYQRQGVGSLLVPAGIERARALGFRSIVLLGHPTYYPRFGFVPAERYGIVPPWGEPTPALMAMPLVPDGLTGVQGRLVYPPAFDAV